MIKGGYGDDTKDVNHSEIQYLEATMAEGVALQAECGNQLSKCLHGIFDADNLNNSFRKLEQYY